MENSYNVEIPSVLKEIVEKIHNEVGCNKGDLTFSTSPFRPSKEPKAFDNNSSIKVIKKENDDFDNMVMENRPGNCSLVKRKQEKNMFEIEHFLSNANTDANADAILNLSFMDFDRMWSNSISPEVHKTYLIKNGNQERQKQELKEQITFPNKPVKVFKCDQCDFQTSRNANLKTHLLRHKNPDDIDIFKCDQCNFKTVWKTALTRHLQRHKNPEEIYMFKCDQCNYQTSRKNELKVHFFRHKKPEDVNMFKCDQCEYQTFRKRNVKKHLLLHTNPKDGNIFECDQCDYQTSHKGNLKLHYRRHKKPEDVNLFKCTECNFQTIWKDALKKHLYRHNGPKDIRMFKCDKCQYQTFRKSDIKKHVFRHKKRALLIPRNR